MVYAGAIDLNEMAHPSFFIKQKLYVLHNLGHNYYCMYTHKLIISAFN